MPESDVTSRAQSSRDNSRASFAPPTFDIPRLSLWMQPQSELPPVSESMLPSGIEGMVSPSFDLVLGEADAYYADASNFINPLACFNINWLDQPRRDAGE
jgi:hypothetical protein